MSSRTLQISLTAAARMLAESENPLLKNSLINFIKKCYNVDMSSSERQENKEFKTFDDFFTRDFHQSARPIAEADFIHPVDAKVVEFGQVNSEHEIFIKHKPYSTDELFITDSSNFISYYLAPYNHHQIYMPVNGQVIRTVYVPGMLYSVKPSAKSCSVVNSKNERLVIFIESEQGPVTLVLVGALLVGSISTVWGQRYFPSKQQDVFEAVVNKSFAKGEAIARFHYGSSVLLVTKQELGTINTGVDGACLMGQAAWN